MKEYKAVLHCLVADVTYSKKINAKNQEAARLVALDWIKTFNLHQPYYVTITEIDWTGSCVTK